MQIVIKLKMPAPTQEQPEPVESRVRRCIDVIKYGVDSKKEWAELSYLYKQLLEEKTPESKKLLALIQPVMGKAGFFGVPEK